MLNCAKHILDELQIPYQVPYYLMVILVLVLEKLDIEAWIPSENKYREISSCSS